MTTIYIGLCLRPKMCVPPKEESDAERTFRLRQEREKVLIDHFQAKGVQMASR
jgi:hypothetical protein